MPAGLIIPTIFTAVDRLSTVVFRMGQNVTSFVGKAQAGVSRLNNKINSLIPGYNSVKGALMGFVGAAVLAGAIISGIVFSVNSLIEYEKKIAAVRLILNDISQSSFKLYQNEIDRVARATRTSAVDVADAAGKIAELNIHLAATPKGLGEVTTAVVTFSRAADLEMAPAAEGLVSIMSQFGLQADQANRTINVLAAGLKYGSANINDQVEAYKNWGIVAKTANITLEQSTALVQVLAKFQLKGAEAGTALRGATIRLQKAGAGYTSGIFNMNDALQQANNKFKSLATARQKDAFLINLFGIRQIVAGRLLLNNIGLYNKLTGQVTGTNEAFVQADIRMDTVAGRLKQLSAGWVNYITSNENGRKGMLRLKNAIVYLTENMDTIIDRVLTAIKWFLILKGAIWGIQIALKAASIAMVAYNIAVGVGAALGLTFGGTLLTNTTALKAWYASVWIAEKATWAWGAALNALGISKAAGVFGSLGNAGKVLGPLIVLLGIIYNYVKEIGKNWDDIGDSFSGGGILKGIRALGLTLTASLLQPLQKFFLWINKITGWDWAKNFATDGVPTTAQGWKDYAVDPYGENSKVPQLYMSPLVQAQQTNSTNTTSNTLDINFNDPSGIIKSSSMRGPVPIPVKVSSTTGNK